MVSYILKNFINKSGPAAHYWTDRRVGGWKVLREKWGRKFITEQTILDELAILLQEALEEYP